MPEDEDDGTDTSSAFTDAERDSIVDELTEDDLRARSQALSDAQETWEELSYMTARKIPCPECSGAGAVSSGSLGDICPRCMGRRMLDQPGEVGVEMPPFAALRGAITAYGNAIADRELPTGHIAKKQLALPAPATVPTLEQIEQLKTQAAAKVRELGSGAPGVVDAPQLPAPKKKRDDGVLGDDAEDAEFDDHELDEMGA